jgi:hypothetical protein
MNIQGKELSEFMLGSGNNNVYSFDTKALSAGVYLIKIETSLSYEIIRFKVVK